MRLRKSILTGQVVPDTQMVRFVTGPDHRVVPDIEAKLPGRGAWIEATSTSIVHASKKNLFARAFKASVSVDQELADTVERLLARRILTYLGFAKKAGVLWIGLDTVLKRMDKGGRWLFEACDGRAENRKRIFNELAALRAHSDPNLEISLIGCFDSRELGLALGRNNVVHALVSDSDLGRKIAAELKRLSGFRELVPPEWGTSELWTDLGKVPETAADARARPNGDRLETM